MAEFFGLARALNKARDPEEREQLATTMYACGDLMGLLQQDPEEWFAGSIEGELSADDIEALIEERRQAKSNKDFDRADAIRDRLAEAGVRIEDGPDGTSWRRA